MARALYGSPLLILMDEPTSSLDSDSEQLFVETFKKHKNKTTIVLVTRKRSLIELCDQVVLIENGKVKAQGKAQEILSQIA
jgi:ATP-binding cassette subfamily C protein LapB